VSSKHNGGGQSSCPAAGLTWPKSYVGGNSSHTQMMTPSMRSVARTPQIRTLIRMPLYPAKAKCSSSSGGLELYAAHRTDTTMLKVISSDGTDSYVHRWGWASATGNVAYARRAETSTRCASVTHQVTQIFCHHNTHIVPGPNVTQKLMHGQHHHYTAGYVKQPAQSEHVRFGCVFCMKTCIQFTPAAKQFARHTQHTQHGSNPYLV